VRKLVPMPSRFALEPCDNMAPLPWLQGDVS
jgi:hypothetical protein